jgi:hypothetical protein
MKRQTINVLQSGSERMLQIKLLKVEHVIQIAYGERVHIWGTLHGQGQRVICVSDLYLPDTLSK